MSGQRRRAGASLRGKSAAKRRRASATVELAILLPILISIMLIACDFGRFVHYYIAVTNAARAGAEYGITTPVTSATLANWRSNVIAAVRNEVSTNSWYEAEPDRLTIATPTSTSEGALAMRTVRVTVTYDFRTSVPWPFLANYNSPRLLTRTIVMRGIR